MGGISLKTNKDEIFIFFCLNSLCLNYREQNCPVLMERKRWHAPSPLCLDAHAYKSWQIVVGTLFSKPARLHGQQSEMMQLAGFMSSHLSNTTSLHRVCY